MKKAICSMGNLHLKGYAKYVGDGLYEFNTEERIKRGKVGYLVSQTDVKVLIK